MLFLSHGVAAVVWCCHCCIICRCRMVLSSAYGIASIVVVQRRGMRVGGVRELERARIVPVKHGANGS
jgi:hypothetical protein